MTLPRSVAFLRGINVGGHRVTKDELIAVFADLGLDRIDTFLASGNVLFEPGQAVTDSEMGAALETTLGYAVPTTVRTAGELEALNQAEPFSAEAVEAMGKPQVMLLFAEPTAEVEAAVLDLATDAEVEEVELYSDEFFALLDRNPWLGRCVARTGGITLAVEGKNVRVKSTGG